MTETQPAANPIGGQIGCAATATFEEMTITAKLGESASVQGTHQSGQVPKCSAPSSAKIVDVQIVGNAAVAKVEEEGFWGTLSFTNYLSLAILDGRWQITCKTFAHTGGTHA